LKNRNFIYGRRSFAEIAKAGAQIRSVLLQDGINFDSEVKDAIKCARERGAKLEYVKRDELDRVTSSANHQGIVAYLGDFVYADLRAAIARGSDKTNELWFILDHIEDVGNFGAIIRSAEFIGAAGIIIANKRSVEVTPTVYKTSAGAVSNIPIVRVANISAACEELKRVGFWIFGADEEAKQTCFEVDMKGKAAIVLGSEHAGISQLVKKQCDFLVRLPKYGQVDSLNVSAAATALGFEFVRQNYEQ
jgi:23S rRNA (guanosine2251-2'-O)-methyltransferase